MFFFLSLSLFFWGRAEDLLKFTNVQVEASGKDVSFGKTKLILGSCLFIETKVSKYQRLENLKGRLFSFWWIQDLKGKCMHCSLPVFWGMLFCSFTPASVLQNLGTAAASSLFYSNYPQRQTVKHTAGGSYPGKAKGITCYYDCDQKYHTHTQGKSFNLTLCMAMWNVFQNSFFFFFKFWVK